MDRNEEQAGRHPPPPRPDDALAARLDRLSAGEAESVIRRALELTDEETHGAEHGSLDRATLEIVARELGIPMKHLTRALAEQQIAAATGGDDTWFDRLMRIDELDGATLVRGNRDAVQQALVTWFNTHEGLRAVQTGPNRGEWEKDTTPLTAIRMGLGMTNSSRALRSAGTVTHEITSLGPDEHLVSIEAGKGLLRATAKGLVAGAISLAVLAGIAIAAGPGNLASGALAAVWTALLFGAGATLAVRSWAGRISRGIRRALGAITHPRESGVYDRLPGKLGSFLENLGFGRGRR